MLKFKKKQSEKAGLPPGALVHIGEKKKEAIRIRLFEYDGARLEERAPEAIEECFPIKAAPVTTWINIDGVHDTGAVQQIGDALGIHPLVLEDIVNTEQRPKLEDMEDYLFCVLKMLTRDEEAGKIQSEQVSILLGPNYVLSFQENAGDPFDMIRNRLRKSMGRLRTSGPDYLAYALVDAIVDHYFLILENLGEEIEGIEEEILQGATSGTPASLHALRRELFFLRKTVWPVREAVSSLRTGESELLQEKTLIFLHDVYDHTVQVLDTVETLREMVAGMHDMYLSGLSNRMNEIMKVLTLIATVFIPMTFIAGVYGMNFKHIPELEWGWGYLFSWAVMLVIGGGMCLYFKKKKWL